MANPAPTINQINAFNATQGTTIDFNIIGGTELVRSNRIYIYDLSDNSLIYTHLYVSTESIHELPPNTDSSIVYESGKSSADFVNGAQYYAQIQTYTDTAGTQGGSGLSVAKMFWCLDDPTLTITTIPSTISTTSYNVSAIYNANTSVVSNIIQQYQFSLYSATGSLLQSSGVVVGSGTQQGTSTAYDISYNFTGLNVGSSYYVTVEVTTTQGMSVSAQSNTFTVSIDTPTLGEATVVNNACDGYISVTSNLSSEYGGSASGEMASFETDSENVFTKLQVDLDPIQDLNGYDKPWVGGAGKNLFYINEQTLDGITISLNNDGSYKMNGSATNAVFLRSNAYLLKAGQYRLSASSSSSSGYVVRIRNADTLGLLTTMNADGGNGVNVSISTDTNVYWEITVFANTTLSNVTVYPQLETGTVKTAFQPYSNICPISGRTEVVSIVSPTTSASDGTTYTTALGRTVYGGTLEQVGGSLTDKLTYLTIDGTTVKANGIATYGNNHRVTIPYPSGLNPNYVGANTYCISDKLYATFQGVIGGAETSFSEIRVFPHSSALMVNFPPNANVSTVAEANAWFAENTPSVVYELATPQTYQLTPQQIQTLVGTNNVWSEQGEISLAYHIPITNLLVKRQDVDDVSGDWLTLYSQPITQASDMDFTFIDFTNQYGKTYKYALVPLLTQTQSGVEVEVEGGYTVSDEVQSVFDGVFISDSTGSHKCKANVGYGNVNMNQSVGSITPIGSQYPIIVTNSNNRYHNGSISGMIVPDDYYYNGNLSRIDMVNKRNELEQFLTNKRAKIIKDWNSNIWLVMIMDNIDCSFDNNYGMGIVTFNANWLEVGDPTNQEDLQATGLVDVGGV